MQHPIHDARSSARLAGLDEAGEQPDRRAVRGVQNVSPKAAASEPGCLISVYISWKVSGEPGVSGARGSAFVPHRAACAKRMDVQKSGRSDITVRYRVARGASNSESMEMWRP